MYLITVSGIYKAVKILRRRTFHVGDDRQLTAVFCVNAHGKFARLFGIHNATDNDGRHKTVLDDIRRTRGENYADSLSDDLFDGYSPICRGDDGDLYSVLFDFGGDAPRPVFWSKVEAVNE